MRVSNNRFKSSRALALAFVLLVPAFSALPASPSSYPTRVMGVEQGAAPGGAPQAPPVQWPRSHDYDVQHYKNVISFDLPGKAVSGETTITLRPFKGDFKQIGRAHV